MRAGLRALALAGAGALLLGLAAPGAVADAPAAGTTYTTAVQVGMTRGEPRVALGPDGALYAAAAQPLGHDSLFKSTDGGATWRLLNNANIPFGGGDDDVYVTPDNTVWMAGQ